MANRTKDEIKILTAMGFSTLRLWIVDDPSIELIKKVFLKSSLTPQDIVIEARKKRTLTGDTSRAIYEHIIFALYNEMCKNPKGAVVEALYQTAWNYVVDKGWSHEYLRIARAFKKGENKSFSIAREKMTFFFFFFAYEQVPLPPNQMHNILDYVLTYERDYIIGRNPGKQRSLTKYHFPDGQSVTESKAYLALKEATIGKMVDYLNTRYQTNDVSVDNWTAFIAQKIHIGIHRDSYFELYTDTIDCLDTAIFESVCYLGNEEYFFGYDLLTTIMGDANLGHERLINYHPNVEELFEIALQAHVEAYFSSTGNKIERTYFRRQALSLVLDNCDLLYNNLVHLYYIDCLYKVLEINRDEYYYNFSWFYDIEKIEEAVSETTEVGAELPKEDTHVEQYAELNAQYERERKHVLEIGKKYAHDLAEKDRIIEARTDEITELRHQLQIQQEYINLTNMPEEPSAADTIDISPLYGKRFLFVGQILESYSELRKTFPDSVFMENETTSIKSLKVDGVVLLIRNMSHSMYYKVMQNSQLAELPRVYCNSRNIHNVYQAMLQAVKR